MKWILLSVATTLAFGAVALADSSKSNVTGVPEPVMLALQNQPQAQQEAKTFIGTIHKSGQQFVLRLDASKESYQLDDQQTASKFAGKKVKVVGVLDASNNTIRVQSIEEANA
jgi:hypothetical protein